MRLGVSVEGSIPTELFNANPNGVVTGGVVDEGSLGVSRRAKDRTTHGEANLNRMSKIKLNISNGNEGAIHVGPGAAFRVGIEIVKGHCERVYVQILVKSRF